MATPIPPNAAEFTLVGFRVSKFASFNFLERLPFSGGIPIEDELRDVPTGKGVLNLKEWTDAVKATGYRGWWAAETFSRNMQQQSVNVVARDMLQLLGRLVGAS